MNRIDALKTFVYAALASSAIAIGVNQYLKNTKEINITSNPTEYADLSSTQLIEEANYNLQEANFIADLAKDNFEDQTDWNTWEESVKEKIKGLEKLLTIPYRFETKNYTPNQRATLVKNAQKADDIVESTRIDEICDVYGSKASFRIPYLNNVDSPNPDKDVNYANIQIINTYRNKQGHRMTEVEVSINGRDAVTHLLDGTKNDYTIGDLVPGDM